MVVSCDTGLYRQEKIRRGSVLATRDLYRCVIARRGSVLLTRDYVMAIHVILSHHCICGQIPFRMVLDVELGYHIHEEYC